MTTLYDIEVTSLDGKQQRLSQYEGKVLLIVNTASKCGFTPQYTGLQRLYDQYREQGLVVLGFPCNQFANQEPGDEAEIASFCSLNHGVTFPMFAKVDVRGNGQHPLFAYLTQQARGALGTKAIKWNFTKFLVDRSGRVVQRFAPNTTPERLEPQIRKLL